MAWQDYRTPAVIAAGALLRLLLFSRSDLVEYLGSRLELSTPVTSWKSLQEGIYLFQQGQDPYQGSIYRQAALLLPIFGSLPSFAIPFIYTLADLGTTLAILEVAKNKASDGQSTSQSDPLQSWWIALLVLFNPLSFLSTVSRATTCFSNLAISTALYNATAGNFVLSMICFSVALHISAPIILLPALLLVLNHARKESLGATLRAALPALAIHHIALLAASYTLLEGPSFLRTYTAIFTVQDLTPNIGLSWYFFIEMFDHFRNFFLLVFQAHLICYAIPVCLKLRFDPLLAFTVLTGIMATFKSYPTVGDTALYLSLLTLFPELVQHMRHPLFTIMAHLYTLLLLPTFHHLWLYAGSGNSNFYYASTLVWALANGLGIMDTLGAGLKRRFLWEQKNAGHPALQKDWQKPDDKRWSVIQY